HAQADSERQRGAKQRPPAHRLSRAAWEEDQPQSENRGEEDDRCHPEGIGFCHDSALPLIEPVFRLAASPRQARAPALAGGSRLNVGCHPAVTIVTKYVSSRNNPTAASTRNST